jgi:hypothetical protein
MTKKKVVKKSEGIRSNAVKKRDGRHTRVGKVVPMKESIPHDEETDDELDEAFSSLEFAEAEEKFLNDNADLLEEGEEEEEVDDGREFVIEKGGRGGAVASHQAKRKKVGEEIQESHPDDIRTCNKPILDLGKQIGGKSYVAGIATAMKHFQKFLDLVSQENRNYTGCKFNVIDTKLITQELFNKFGGYLCETIAKVDTALGYFSKVRTYYLNDEVYKRLVREELDEAWNKKTRSKIFKYFVEKCSKEGTRLTERSTPMEEEDLELLCTLLLNRNNRTSLESRCLLIMQWQTVGRISECFLLRLEHLSFHKSSNNRSLVIDFARSKTGIEQVSDETIHEECTYILT